MNERVLELLKAPKNIQSEDLGLLKQEIDAYPYIQNIRALYLYGVHRYDPGNYQKVLSTTAAYTTDKKILYQLINGKIHQKPKTEAATAGNPPVKPAAGKETGEAAPKPKNSGFPLLRQDAATFSAAAGPGSLPEEEAGNTENGERLLPLPKPESKPVYTNGELNRILFEGEENFLEDGEVETIDLESTLESGSIVTQKPHKDTQSAGLGNPQSKEKGHEAESSEDEGYDSEKEEIQPALTGEKISSDENEKNIHEPGGVHGSDAGTIKEGIPLVSVIQQEPTGSTAGPEAVEKPDSETGKKPDGSVIAEKDTAYPEDRQNPGTAEKVQGNTEAGIKSGADFTPETVIEERIAEDKEKILDDALLSFHETAPVVPGNPVETTPGTGENVPEEDKTDNSAEEARPDVLFTPEKIIHEDEVPEEKESVQDESKLSFHGTESFLPEVHIPADLPEEVPQENFQPDINKHEVEMRRLIEEVEKKMKERAAAGNTEKPSDGKPSDYSNTGSAETMPSEPSSAPELQEAETSSEERPEQAGEETKESEDAKSQPDTEERNSGWKPMAFQPNLPDSLLNRPAADFLPAGKTEAGLPSGEKTRGKEETVPQKEALTENPADHPEDQVAIQEKQENTESAENEEAPVMNVSFFGSGWTIAQPEAPAMKEEPVHQEYPQAEEKETVKEQEPAAAATQPLDSNVPGFINTWQSWLKIDRTEEIQKEKTEIKAKVIEAFIESNPRISQLKDESTFVVKEKGDDISHLMTETLANLYFEQKLYTKAIKAFEILIRKSPEKEAYFKGKIQEIKDFRTK